MPTTDRVARWLEVPREDLERELALLYEAGLLALQERMHPGSTQPPPAEGVILRPRPGTTTRPGENESARELAAHGRKIVAAMLEPVRDALCAGFRDHPEQFAGGTAAVPRIARHFTRVEPPDELFLAAACLLWREGLEHVCEGSGRAA